MDQGSPRGDDQRAQTIRLRRLGMAAGSYVFTVGVAAGCVAAGLLAPEVALTYTAGVVAVNALFFALIRSGWNLRLADPSLTAPQIVAAMLLHLHPMAAGGTVRGPLLLLAPIPFLYGLFRLDQRRLLALGGCYLAGYLALLGGLALRERSLDPAVEALRFIALAVVLTQIAWVGGYLTRLRQKLRERNEELEEALTRIAELATHDELTGLPNRRALLDGLESAVRRCERGARPVVVALLDLDHFKEVNDTWGHGAGDAVLRRVARSVAGGVRRGDAFGRLGGEEFVAVLTETDRLGAGGMAERLRQTVESLDLGDVAEGLRITVSIGLAVWRPGEDGGRLLGRADRALYAAKRGGRNAVAWADAGRETAHA